MAGSGKTGNDTHKEDDWEEKADDYVATQWEFLHADDR